MSGRAPLARGGLGVALALWLAGCATSDAFRQGDVVPDAQLTVLVFFSPNCPCQRAHDARLVALAERFSERAVAVRAVASEADLSARDLAAERQLRRYPFPIARDTDGRLARAAGVTFATDSVILDAGRHVIYRGGIDSDTVVLHDDATPYLANAVGRALAAIAAGADPRDLRAAMRGVPQHDGRGCVLRVP